MFKVAPIVMKDFDWALINSLLMVFNTCDAIFYVNWCYDILFERTKSIKIYNRMSSIIHLCGAHWIKQTVKKIKKVNKHKNDEKKNKLHQKTCIFLFGLLQNVKDIKEFIDTFIHIYNLL
jgi:hypothetical protein